MAQRRKPLMLFGLQIAALIHNSKNARRAN